MAGRNMLVIGSAAAVLALLASSCTTTSTTTPTDDAGTDAMVPTGPCGTLTSCGNLCVDLQTNADNCGACGAACGGGQRCVGGKCDATCSPPWTECADGPDAGTSSCVNLQADPNHCGACNNKCQQGYACVLQGNTPTCTPSCQGGTTQCGQKCVDTKVDPANCGACGVICNGGCTNGQCCPAGQMFCNGQCRPQNQCLSITAGLGHTCASGGSTAKCWGYNGDGEIGDGTKTNRSTAVQVTGSSVVPPSIGAGALHTCAVDGSGGVQCWATTSMASSATVRAASTRAARSR